jgi:hypothetical protein
MASLFHKPGNDLSRIEILSHFLSFRVFNYGITGPPPRSVLCFKEYIHLMIRPVEEVSGDWTGSAKDGGEGSR